MKVIIGMSGSTRNFVLEIVIKAEIQNIKEGYTAIRLPFKGVNFKQGYKELRKDKKSREKSEWTAPRIPSTYRTKKNGLEHVN